MKEWKQAEEALAAAQAAEAETYAPDTLKQARQSLSLYDGDVAQRDYQQALKHAVEARDQAYDAAKQATDLRAQLKTQFDKLASDTQRLHDPAWPRLASPTARAAATPALRTAIKNGNSAMQEARARADKGDLAGAVKRLTGVPEMLLRETAAFEGTGRRGRGPTGAAKIADSALPAA